MHLRSVRTVHALLLPLVLMAASACSREPRPRAPRRRESTPAVSVGEYPQWLGRYYQERQWRDRPVDRRLERETLQKSLLLGKFFLLANQRPAGNFNYEYDFVAREQSTQDNQVRQAGALWGVALIHQHSHDRASRRAVDRGLDFFFEHTRPGPAEGSLLIAYPGARRCKNGTVALVALSIVELLRTADAGHTRLTPARRRELEAKLDGYLAYLTALQLDNKHFADTCDLGRNELSSSFNPYVDGEVLLCLIKAARYAGRERLRPFVEATAMTLARDYTAVAWEHEKDSNATKGFFQWSCMAFWEYYDAGWENAVVFGDYVLSLAWWMIHTHRTLARTRNTAYAYEGIIHAWLVARDRNDEAALAELGYTIDRGLYKLTSWQVHGPLAHTNAFLRQHPTAEREAIGGVMNHRREAPLRIDVTQHQMHAVILALRHVYTADDAADAAAAGQ